METHEQAEEPETTRWTTATVFPDMWTDPDDDPRETDTPVTDERTMLLEYLRYYRLTLEMKCAGLDAEQLARRSAPPSSMSLLGLVRHLASGERHLRRVMTGEDAPELSRTDEDREADWTGAIADPEVVDDAWRSWRAETAATDRYLDGVTDLSTGNTGASDFGPDGADLQLREAVLGQIVEYARLCGHADLLRDRVDGRVGQ